MEELLEQTIFEIDQYGELYVEEGKKNSLKHAWLAVIGGW